MTHTKIILVFVGLFVFHSTAIWGQSERAARYEPGDWITYGNFHYITGFAKGDNQFFIGTTHGVLRYDQLSREWKYPYTAGSGLSDSYVLNVQYVDSNQKLWVFTRGGVDVISLVTNRWEHIENTEHILRSDVRRVTVRNSGQDVYVVNGANRVYRINKFTHYVREIENLPSNIGSDTQAIPNPLPLYNLNGPWIIDRNTNRLEDDNFREYPFTSMVRDSRQQTWLGTWGAGFIRADATSKVGRVWRIGPISNAVGAMYKDGEQFWFGGAQSRYSGPPSIEGEPGISYWDMDRDEWHHWRQNEEYRINDATIYNIDGDEHSVWFGTERGLLHYSKEKSRWMNISNSSLGSHQVYEVLVQDTSVWVASRSGLYRVSNPTGGFTENISILKERMIGVYALARINNILYAGTDNGLVELDLATMEMKYYDRNGNYVPAEKFSEFRVYAIAAGKNNVYYANDFGLFELNLVSKSVQELPKIGIYARSIPRKIEVGPGGVWVAFDDGLGQYNPENREWEYFTREDGLASNLVYDIVPENEYIWIATHQGVTRFNPSNLNLR
ncbi:MAG: hypothetical protein K9N46_02885 [Candidatus Marinimicrobia bacterium]|nr:hypothetical protein [Candidatus Neomarinimicrobiota bacterium]MCF7828157.1 hypothetical protein [Candidatus Neomarinimicrobiota bacterium]MCF7879668.1 hypothetical protein [Candidatus Neomarinimicrobiota bacterium]